MKAGPDVVVIGGGAGGLTAASQAKRMGASVMLVADGPIGGDCTHTGCVPSKTLIAAAARGDDFETAMATVQPPSIGSPPRRTPIASPGGHRGRTRPCPTHELDCRRRNDRARSLHHPRHRRALIPGLASVSPLSNESVFDLTSLPPSLSIIGAGAIGCELAQAFTRFATTVTLLDVADRVLAGEEPEASAVVDAALRRSGVDIRVGVGIATVTVTVTASGVRLVLADASTADAALVLVAAGR